MGKPAKNKSEHDPQVGEGKLHWDGPGEVSEVANFRRRGYSNIVYDAWTKTSGSPKLIALVKKALDFGQHVFLNRYLVARLPFRVRWSAQRSFGLGPEQLPIVSISNPISIKSDAEWKALAVGPHTELPAGTDPFTWSLVSLGSKRLKGEKLGLLSKDTGDLKAIEKVFQPEWEEIEAARSALNRFIVAYWYAAGTPIKENRVRLLTDADMVREPHAWLSCVSNVRESSCAVSQEWQSFPTTRKPSDQVNLFGERNDLAGAVFEKIESALVKESDYPALYFAFAGEGYMRSGHYQNALLYYAMAFESAHQHFVEYALTHLGVPEPEARSNDLHMRAGITTLIKLSLHLFLTASERPSKDAVEKTRRAIELRNSWVHGKRDKNGRLHALQIGRVEIAELIKGVVESTNVLLGILP